MVWSIAFWICAIVANLGLLAVLLWQRRRNPPATQAPASLKPTDDSSTDD